MALGNFINAIIAFLILAVVIFFFVIKPINLLMTIARRKAEEAPAEPAPIPDDVKLLMEIRDLLKQQSGETKPAL
jgi:large conductance mechanosensitive channel